MSAAGELIVSGLAEHACCFTEQQARELLARHAHELAATAPDLSPEERQFLSFALDQAAEEMTLRDGFTEDDQTALEKFRGWVGER